MYKKPVIVFEGIEGSGKTFHLDNVAKYLKKKKIPFIKIREPGGSVNSEKIRNLLLNNKSKFNRSSDLLLYLASRSENMSLLKKNYKKKIILIDRFIDSTIAYQHYGFGIDLNLIKKINSYLLGTFRITHTILNTVNLKNMKLRLKKRKKLNRYDKFSIKFYNKVQKGFLSLSKKNKSKYILINSNLDINYNKDLIIKKIEKLIK